MFVSDENFTLINNALAKLIDDAKKSDEVDLRDFFYRAEEKFTEAGYRDDVHRRQILIIQDGGIGDFVATSGAIREIRRIYPSAYISLMIPSKVRDMAEFCPYVDEFFTFSNIADLYADCFEYTKILRRCYYDICFTFAKWADALLMMYLSGAKIRITHDFSDVSRQIWYGANNSLTRVFLNLATHLAPLNVYGNHMADACFSLIESLIHAPVDNRSIEVWFNDEDLNFAKNLLPNENFYVMSMGGSHARKHYPPEKYAELVEMILDEDPNAKFVIVGGEKDSTSAEIFKNSLSHINSIVDLTGKTNYRQTAAVISLCDMYIGNDNGALHIASALNRPVLTPNCFPKDLPLTDNDVPILWRPYNVPHVMVQPEHALDECIGGHYDHHGCKVISKPHCITQISPQSLFDGFHQLKMACI